MNTRPYTEFEPTGSVTSPRLRFVQEIGSAQLNASFRVDVREATPPRLPPYNGTTSRFEFAAFWGLGLAVAASLYYAVSGSVNLASNLDQITAALSGEQVPPVYDTNTSFARSPIHPPSPAAFPAALLSPLPRRRTAMLDFGGG